VIVPSIDLMGGRAVQLRRGDPDDCALAVDDVLGLAERYARVGDLAVIDLDRALGRGDNEALVRQLCARFPCRVGGGIRTVELGRALLRAGAQQIIVGTKAEPAFLEQLAPSQVIVAVDERGGEVVDEGWTRGTGVSVLDRVRALSPYCSGFLYTAVDREGLLAGTALGRVRAVREATDRRVTAAGGIASIEEVRALAEMGVESQLGMAIYTGALDLPELFCALTDFQKHGGLVPTAVVREDGVLLMLAWSSPDTLRAALTEGVGIYWSRSRQKVWRKGEESGHTQALLRARLDCDRDTVRFTVRQTGPCCHLGQDTCWGEAAPTLGALEAILQDRLDHPTGSFGSKLMASERLIRRKLHEEVWEVSDAETPDETIHEAADLLFFATALLVKRGVRWEDVLRALRGRRRS